MFCKNSLKKNILLLVVVLIVIILPACKKKIINTNPKLNQKNSFITKPFKLSIGGVECPVCVHSIIKLLNNITQISRIQYICPENNYSNAYANIYLKNTKNNINFDLIKNILSKNGFNLNSLSGQFFGHFTNKNNQIIFNLFDLNYSFKVISNKQDFNNNPIIIDGTIKLNPNTNEYWLYI